MNDREKIVRNVGEMLDRSLGSGPGESSLEMQKRILVSTMASNTGGQKHRFLLVAAAACMAMCVAFVTYFLAGEESGRQVIPESNSIQNDIQHRFKIGNEVGFATVGSLVQSTVKSNVPIVFENGSRFDLFGRSSVRIVETHPERVAVRLLDGGLNSSINGNGTTQWVVLAGPYSVKVLGTIFSVHWDEKRGVLQVRVEEGRVLVGGGGGVEGDVDLRAGQMMSVSRDSNAAAVREENPEAQKEIEHGKDHIPECEVGEIRSARVMEPKKHKRSIVKRVDAQSEGDGGDESLELDWRDYCARKQFKAVLENASRSDLAEVMTEAELETLWRLANSARYLKKSEVAKKLFDSLRQRFPESRRARTAAFLIAKTFLELEGNKESARKWFELYLSEASSGALREEALSHLFTIAVSSGLSEEAQSEARRYLEQYPNGQHSKRAHEIVSP